MIVEVWLDRFEEFLVNYEMMIVYMMVILVQLFVWGESKGILLVVYNLYFEVLFDFSVFLIKRFIDMFCGEIMIEYGVQSNCMICYVMVNYGGGCGLGYGVNFCIGREDLVFIDFVQIDFLWLILDDVQ